MRTSYLLSLTGGIPVYITQLPLVDARDPLADDADLDDGASAVSVGTSGTMREAETTLRRLLHFLREVDCGWVAVLSGEAWVVEHGRGRAVKVGFGGQVGATERLVTSDKPVTGLNRLHSIRLRSIMISARQRLVAWARQYGDFKGETLNAEHDIAAKESQDRPAAAASDWDWEMEIRRMWNGTAELLTDLDEGPS